MSTERLERALWVWRRGMEDGNGSAIGHDGDGPGDAARREGWRVLADNGAAALAQDGPDVIIVAMAPLWGGEVEHAWAVWGAE